MKVSNKLAKQSTAGKGQHKQQNPWVIVGTGALGSILGARLIQQGLAVTFIPRQPTPKALLKVSGHTEFQGRIKTWHPQAKQAIHPPELTAPQAPLHQSFSQQSIWVFAVKAWQLETALTHYAPYLPRAEALIISHNGLGAAEAILTQQEQAKIFDWVTTQGGYRLPTESSENKAKADKSSIPCIQVVHSGLGESWLGRRFQRVKEVPKWFHTFQQSLPPAVWDMDIQKRRWYKLAVNCVINARAALAGEPNGWLAQVSLQAELQQNCLEVAQIMHAELALSDSETHNTSITKTAEAFYGLAKRVIQQTARNKNSMLQDIQAKRSTEIEFLNGFIHKKGQQHQVATPINSLLYQQILAVSDG